MSGLQSLASTMIFFTHSRRMACLTFQMSFISLVSTASLSLDSEQILSPLLEDGIIIPSGQKVVSLLNSSGVWDIYKSWTRARDLRSFRILALTGRVLYCKKNLTAQLWFLKLNAHWMRKPWRDFRELLIPWNILSTQSLYVTNLKFSLSRSVREYLGFLPLSKKYLSVVHTEV